MSRSDRGDRERWHGEAVTDEGAGFGLGSLSAEEISPPAGGELLCPWRLVVAKSTPLRFRLTAKTAFVPLLLLFPANPLRWALPGITRDWAKRHRGRGRWTLRAHRTAFPGPHYGGRVSVRFCTISGAQKWSGLRDFFRATGPWLFKNCRCCGSTTAPGLAEQVAAGAGL